MSKQKNENRVAGIYKITNITNNQVYIGESLNIEERWEKHKKNLKDGTHHSYKLQNDYNKFGEDNFTYEIIEELDKEYNTALQNLILLAYEDKYIKQYDSIENGYNCEYTLWKILNKEKSIFQRMGINEMHLKMLIGVIKNINKNNGVYVLPDNKKSKQIKKSKGINKSKNNIAKELNIDTFIIDINTDKIVIKDFIDYFRKNGFKIHGAYSSILNKLMDNNILYLDKDNVFTPTKEYKYLEYEKLIDCNYKNYSKIYILKEGYRYMMNKLIELIELNIIEYKL